VVCVGGDGEGGGGQEGRLMYVIDDSATVMHFNRVLAVGLGLGRVKLVCVVIAYMVRPPTM
jgi:hypothetical protein